MRHGRKTKVVSVMKKYITFCENLNRIMLGIGVLFLSSAVFLTFAQVVTRNLLSLSFTWADEVTRYIVIFAVYSASGSVFYLDMNARVDILYNCFSKKTRAILSAVFYLLIAIFLLVMCYYGFVFIKRNMNVWCASIHIPWAIPFSSLVLGSANMVLQIPAKLYQCWQDFCYK